jgi:hypothetical protein
MTPTPRSSRATTPRCPAGKLQGSQLAVTVPAARGGAAALLREAEPVRDSLLQAAEEPMSDKVMLVVKQLAGLL